MEITKIPKLNLFAKKNEVKMIYKKKKITFIIFYSCDMISKYNLRDLFQKNSQTSMIIWVYNF